VSCGTEGIHEIGNGDASLESAKRSRYREVVCKEGGGKFDVLDRGWGGLSQWVESPSKSRLHAGVRPLRAC
jgi:hypothetical protein